MDDLLKAIKNKDENYFIKNKNKLNKECLDLKNMEISDIWFLKYYPDIVYLDLSNNKIDDTKPLSYCTKLRTLILNNNKIKRLKGVKYC